MTKTTHVTAGVALSLGVALLTKENLNITDAITIIGLSGFGATIPDIDLDTTTKLRKTFATILSLIVAIFVVFGFYLHKVNLLFPLINNMSFLSVAGVLGFLVACTIGYFSDHRTFTHQAIGLVCFCLPLYFIVGNGCFWFGLGMLSHQVLDMLNKKRIDWLYPLKFNFAFYLVPAHGFWNNAICVISTCAIGVALTQIIKI